MKTHQILVTVEAPDDAPTERVKELLDALINAGLADAHATLNDGEGDTVSAQQASECEFTLSTLRGWRLRVDEGEKKPEEWLEIHYEDRPGWILVVAEVDKFTAYLLHESDEWMRSAAACYATYEELAKPPYED